MEHMGIAAEEERRKEEGQRSRRRQADLPWIRLAQVLIVFTALCLGVEDSFKGGYQVNIWIQCIRWESSQSCSADRWGRRRQGRFEEPTKGPQHEEEASGQNFQIEEGQDGEDQSMDVIQGRAQEASRCRTGEVQERHGIDLEIQKAMDKIEELDIDAATRDVKGADAMDMDAATNRELKEQLLLAQREQSNTARMLALLQTQFNAYVGQGAHGPMPSEPRIAASPSDLRKQRLNAIEKTGPTYPSQIPTFRLDEDRERSPRRSEPGGADSQELNKLG